MEETGTSRVKQAAHRRPRSPGSSPGALPWEVTGPEVGQEEAVLWGTDSLALSANACATVKTSKANTTSFKGQVTSFQHLSSTVLLEKVVYIQGIPRKKHKEFPRTRCFKTNQESL